MCDISNMAGEGEIDNFESISLKILNFKQFKDACKQLNDYQIHFERYNGDGKQKGHYLLLSTPISYFITAFIV